MTITTDPAPDTRPPAVIYARISRDQDDERNGVDRQVKDCRALAERLGFRIAGEPYIDNNVSAYSGKPRPQYQRMIHDLSRPGAPRNVIVWHLDRLHRSPKELEALIDFALAGDGVRIHADQGGVVDLATSEGRLSARIAGGVARYESEHKSARIQALRRHERENGRDTFGNVPFGWRKIEGVKDRYELDEPTATTIAKSIRAALDGRSFHAIAQDWNEAGFTRPRGKSGDTWNVQLVRQMLRRWRNAGRLDYRGEDHGKSLSPALPGITVEDIRALRRMGEAASARYATYTRGSHLLTGIARCWCGRTVVAQKQGRGPLSARTWVDGYVCSIITTAAGMKGHVARTAEHVDKYVIASVAAAMAADTGILTELTRADDDSGDVARLRKSVERITTTLIAANDLMFSGVMTPEEYTRRAPALRAERDALETQISALARQSAIKPYLDDPEPDRVFREAALIAQRAVFSECVDVQFVKDGTRRGGPRFSPDSVAITWKVDGYTPSAAPAVAALFVEMHGTKGVNSARAQCGCFAELCVLRCAIRDDGFPADLLRTGAQSGRSPGSSARRALPGRDRGAGRSRGAEQTDAHRGVRVVRCGILDHQSAAQVLQGRAHSGSG